MVEYQYANPMWPFFILFIVYDIDTLAYHRQPILYIKKKIKRGLFKSYRGENRVYQHIKIKIVDETIISLFIIPH